MTALYWFLACVGLVGGIGLILVGVAGCRAAQDYQHAMQWYRAKAILELAAKHQRGLWVSATKAGRASAQLTDNDLSKLLRDIKAGALVMAREEGLDIVAAVGGQNSFEAFAWLETVKLS